MTQFGGIVSLPLSAVEVPSPFISGISAAATNSTNSTAVLQTQFQTIQTEYWAKMSVGTPSKQFNVLLDTGSFDMWLFGTDCLDRDCRSAQRRYNVSASPTGQRLNKKAPKVTYADGMQYEGDRVSDDIQIGSLKLSAFEFTQVTNFSQPWNPDGAANCDGIVGMGLSAKDVPAAPSFAEALMEKKVIANGVFSYFIQVKEQNGVATFGGYNSSYFQNASIPPSWIPYMQDDNLITGKIAIPLTTTMVGRNVVESFTTHSSQLDGTPEGNAGAAIIDTGTSQSFVSYELVDEIARQLSTNASLQVAKIYYSNNDTSQYTYKVDCSAKHEKSGPTVTLGFAGGLTLTITAQEYISNPQGVPGATFCQLQLRGMKNGYAPGIYLLGNTFLKRYVSIFDYDNQRVGFALARGRNLRYGTVGFNASAITYIPSKSNTTTHPGDKVAIIVSVCGAVLLVVVGAAFWWFRRRKSSTVEPAEVEFYVETNKKEEGNVDTMERRLIHSGTIGSEGDSFKADETLSRHDSTLSRPL
ncbi:acid protease [Rhizoclosmatium globosum]|uniref:Acid protease n=1 Tax=Rhizoclosmatium globosum TaxID=329046 RepID=A0A1Y2BRD6_9FUNG|nr:acid protease [Rhizoclosmatium globosum]|eukprot:ORY37293.1 acid protease [Rhizoclosmatium globosum]